MKPILFILAVGFTSLTPCRAADQDPLEKIKEATRKDLAYSDEDAALKKTELGKKYADALTGLEKKSQADGDLDLILHIREEREAIEKSGTPSAYSDLKLVDLRKIYVAARADLDAKQKAARAKVLDSRTRQIQEQEVALTKSGNLDGALALRQAREKFLLEFGEGGSVPMADDPRVPKTAVATGAVREVQIPEKTPAEGDKPFNKPLWMESMTVPVAKQRVKASITIGDRGKHSEPYILVAPHSLWSGADSGRVDVSFGSIVARHCTFEKLPFTTDLSANIFYANCKLEDCSFSKGGVWYGSEQAGKFYFEKCLVRGKFFGSLNIIDNGVRGQGSVFELIDLPKVSFRKKQVADYRNHPWEAFVNCRFVHCKVPFSFLLLTHDCVFEDCSFLSETDNELNITKPVEVTYYAEKCKSNLPAQIPNVVLIQKHESDLKGVVVPTLSSITAGLD